MLFLYIHEHVFSSFLKICKVSLKLKNKIRKCENQAHVWQVAASLSAVGLISSEGHLVGMFAPNGAIIITEERRAEKEFVHYTHNFTIS